MKTLSILQPYASQIVFGLKKIEYRTWQTSYRGRIAIHASGKDDYDLPADETTPLLNAINNDDFFGKYVSKNENGEILKTCEGFDNEWKVFAIICGIYAEDTRLPICPAAAIVGSVEISDIIQTGDKKFEWHLINPVYLSNPLLYIKGRLNLWEFNPPPGITI